MRWFFVRGMVWLAYPLMALMVGAMVVGGRSEGRIIAYTWRVHRDVGDEELFLMDLNYQLTVSITDGVSSIHPFTWLNENTLIYFRADPSQSPIISDRDYHYESYTLSEGSHLLNSTTDIYEELSPDGSYVAYRLENNLYTRDLTIGQMTQITDSLDLQVLVSEWSADGCHIAYVQSPGFDEQNAKLWIYDVCSGESSLLTQDFRFRSLRDTIIWSPSGNHLMFSGESGGMFGHSFIQVFDVETHEDILPELNTYVATGRGVSWSATSNQFVFSAREDSSQPSNIYIADVDIGTIIKLTDSTSNDFFPVWSRDGTQIAFTSNLQAANFQDRQLYIMDVDGSNIRRVSDVDQYVIRAQWQPLR